MWQDAVETSLHIYNRQPIRYYNWFTPIQLWNGTKPDLSYFRTFGCQAYVFIPKDKQPNKLTPKSEDMILVGYEPGTKGYHFWSRIRRTIVISSTTTFDDFEFPNCPREKQLTNHLLKINLQKLTTNRIQIKEEMTIYNLLIKINQIMHCLKDLTQVYQDQILRIVTMIYIINLDHPNKQVANQQERINRILLLLFHLDLQSHLDLTFLNHLNIPIHL